MSRIDSKELHEIIQYHIDDSMLLSVERTFDDEVDVVHGFPIKISEELLLMTVINDFHDEGFVILRLSDISDAYSKENDAFYEKICISEGLQNKVQQCYVNNICSVKCALQQLESYDGFISVECEEQRKKCTFFLGKIITVEDDGVNFKDIGIDGEWDNEAHKILYGDITQISFGDNYSKIYYKYASK